ncbi:ABC transporter substrate-binding protein [Promicromonospora soli]|uniref:Nitrate ABC transporter substrate-binding protein n=1 Tax=Promicromonospora soli TaxID=2035533 RepID=A0A919G072_9MICO|nr:ABC transporter substrate-binding protein [Promicromonospora soli]GHH74835.1 nitrate ABC transporter substrate-binding protein [Promicromonospora soli]
MTPRILTSSVVVGAAATALVALAGCATGDDTAAASDAGSAISAERCAENEAAGTITFLTGYQYQASASILEIVAADELGYFDALCLDVEIQPGTGDTGQNTQLVASDQVQFTSVSQQNLLQAHDTGIDLRGISSYSNVGLEILMTMPEVTDLAELDGTILGHKGGLPAAVEAMLDEAGADVDSMQQVVVGYDPSILPRGQVDSLTGFISNEPNLLTASGEDVTVWRPYDFGVPSSLGSLAVNPAFADEHPGVVEDFLRASFHAFEYCEANAEECVGYTAELSGEGYDVDHNVNIWTTETEIVRESQRDGANFGAIDEENVVAIVDLLNGFSLLENDISEDEALGLFETSYVDAIFADGELIWPAP